MLSLFTPTAAAATVKPAPLEVKSAPVHGVPVLVTRRARRGKGQKSRGHAVGVVPELETSVVFRHKFRFECTTGESVNISLLGIWGALGGICTVANSVLTTWTGSLRVRKIEIYESAQLVSTVNSAVNWYTNSNSNLADKLMLNSTIPYDLPSKIVAVPPKNTLADFWWNSSAASSLALFGIMTSVGSIIDLTVEFTLGNQAGGYQPTIATGTLGGDYYLALDGSTSNKYVPIGLPTTH